jgi:hypothetical protein
LAKADGRAVRCLRSAGPPWLTGRTRRMAVPSEAQDAKVGGSPGTRTRNQLIKRQPEAFPKYFVVKSMQLLADSCTQRCTQIQRAFLLISPWV